MNRASRAFETVAGEAETGARHTATAAGTAARLMVMRRIQTTTGKHTGTGIGTGTTTAGTDIVGPVPSPTPGREMKRTRLPLPK
jgi:hypothetical protein